MTIPTTGMNKPTIAIAIVGWVAAGALAWMLKTQHSSEAVQAARLAELQKQLTAKAKIDEIDLQEKCAAQATRLFREFDWAQMAGAAYGSHFNLRLNSCLVTVETYGTTITKTLYEAYSRREYARYFWKMDEHKKYWEVPPVICELKSPEAAAIHCNSGDEYDALVAAYMEEKP